jgi:hypothetical protein
MTTLRALKKLFLGETWLLPGALAAAVAATLLIRSALGNDWHQSGGFVLLGLVVVVIVASVARSARAR